MARKKQVNTIPSQPVTRVERYLDVIAGGVGTKPTNPETRIERYLDVIADVGISGGAIKIGDVVTSDTVTYQNGSAHVDYSGTGGGFNMELPIKGRDNEITVDADESNTHIEIGIDENYTNGYHRDMSVGVSDNLIDRKGIGTEQEFTFRTSGGSESLADDGNGIVQSIHGNTIVWNQLVKNTNKSGSNTTTDTKDYFEFRFRGTNAPTYTLFVKESLYAPGVVQKYFTASTTVDNVQVLHNGSSSNIVLFSLEHNIIEGHKYILNMDFTGVDVTTVGGVTWDNAILFDLTAMFGSGNEPSTVAEFRSLFPLDYYAYNSGALLSYNGTGIKTVGFNSYNPSTGTATLLGGNQYQITGDYTSVSYSTGETITIAGDGTFTPSANGTLTVIGGNDTNTCVHLTWSGYRNGEYEPYFERTLSLPIETYFVDGMRSVGSVYDELTPSKAIKRIGEQIISGAIGDTVELSGCSTNATTYTCAKGDIGILANGILTLTATVTSEKVQYELAVPTEEAISPELELVYKVNDFGTEQSLPENTSTPTTSPIKAIIKYSMDFTREIVNLPKNYDTTDSLDALCTALATTLGTALNGTFTITRGAYDSTNKKYAWTCVFTKNN